MKVDNHFEAFLLSIMLISLAVGGVFTLKALAPGAYNQITGRAVTVGSTVNITGAPEANCSFTLYDGMNLASFRCVGDFWPIGDAFSETGLIGAWEYKKGDSDPWKAYKRDVPSYVINDLSSLAKRKGYWVKVNETQQFFLEGRMSSRTEIDLTAGYQLVGYPNNKTEHVNTSFDTIEGNFTQVVGFDPSAKSFEIYVPGSGGSLNETTPGRGYWINATTTETWVVD